MRTTTPSNTIHYNKGTTRVRSLFTHKKTNYLWCIVFCVCISFHFELLQFQSLLCSFISFPFHLFCVRERERTHTYLHIFTFFSTRVCGSNCDATEICIQFIFSQYFCRFSFFLSPFPFQWLFPLWVLITRAHSWMRCS